LEHWSIGALGHWGIDFVNTILFVSSLSMIGLWKNKMENEKEQTREREKENKNKNEKEVVLWKKNGEDQKL
jgi:hypothetical protein